MPLVLLIGGARSGKSDLAVRLAARQGAEVVVIATAEAGDTEMAERIAAHRRERPASWQTIEEPLRLDEAISSAGADRCVIVDCLTVWTANVLAALGQEAAEAAAVAAAGATAGRAGLTIAVTNEVGLGIVPDNALARSYRDLLGRVNAIWSDAADEVLLLVAGRALPLSRLSELERWS